MPILGIVLVLDDSAASTRTRVGVALRGAPDLDLGDPAGHRWPVVLESPGEREAESRIAALRQTPGVASVDVVYADFDDLLERTSHTDDRQELQ